jgi:hypothetical protein
LEFHDIGIDADATDTKGLAFVNVLRDLCVVVAHRTGVAAG